MSNTIQTNRKGIMPTVNTPFTFDQLNGLLKTLSIGANNLYGKTVRTDPRSGAGIAAAEELVTTLQSLQTVVAQMLAIVQEEV